MNTRSTQAAEDFQAALQQIEQLFDTVPEMPEFVAGDWSSRLDNAAWDAHPSTTISDQNEPTQGAF